MSEPIIIETPQPPVAPPPKRECLVLVDEGDIVSRNDEWGTQSLHVSPDAAVDFAEPEDLERAGYIPISALDGPLDLSVAPRTTAGVVEEIQSEWTARQATEARLTGRVATLTRERDEAREGRDELARGIQFAHLALGSPHGADLATQCGAVVRERDEARAALATMTRQRDDALQVLGQAREALPSDMRDGWLVDAVRRLVRERDEARREAAKLDAKLAQAEERGDLADQRAIDAIAERDEVRRQRDAEIASRDALARVLEQVERERDEARCLYEAAHCERMRITDVLQHVERERDEARAALATWQGSAEQERARCVAWLRAEAASSDWASCATWGRALSDTADRLERGEHAGTPVPAAEPRGHCLGCADPSLYAASGCPGMAPEPALPRATDEELADVYLGAFRSSGPGDVETARRDGIAAVAARVRAEREPRDMPRATDEELFALAHHAMELRQGVTGAALAVAARVRREQCLVTRAVEAGVKVTITRTSERMPGCCVGLWDVRVTRRPDAPGEHYSHGVPAADVPATVERLLGEVTRG